MALDCVLAPLKSRLIRQNVIRGNKIGKKGFCLPWAAATTASIMRFATKKGFNPASVWRTHEGVTSYDYPGSEVDYRWYVFENLFKDSFGLPIVNCQFNGFWIKLFGQISEDIHIEQDVGTSFIIYKEMPATLLNSFAGRRFGDVFQLEDPDIRYAFGELKILAAEAFDSDSWYPPGITIYVNDPVVTLSLTLKNAISRTGVAGNYTSESTRPWWLTSP